MGALCSKSSTHEGGHTVLGSSAPTTGRQAASNANGGSTLGSGSKPADIRSAAAEAAERRQREAQDRGTHASNPKRGKLAAQAAKPAKFTPTPREEPRLVWD